MITLSSWPSPCPPARALGRILARHQPIDNSLWHHDLTTGRDLVARIAHDASRADIFIGDKLGEPLVLTLRQDGKLLAAGSLDELNLAHDPHDLSIVNSDIMGKRDIAYCDSARYQ